MKKLFLAVIFSSLALAGCKDNEDKSDDKKDSGAVVEEQAVKSDDSNAEVKDSSDNDSASDDTDTDTGASLNTAPGEQLALTEVDESTMPAVTEEVEAMTDSMVDQEGNSAVATEEAEGMVSNDAPEEEDKMDAEDVAEDQAEDEGEVDYDSEAPEEEE